MQSAQRAQYERVQQQEPSERVQEFSLAQFERVERLVGAELQAGMSCDSVEIELLSSYLEDQEDDDGAFLLDTDTCVRRNTRSPDTRSDDEDTRYDADSRVLECADTSAADTRQGRRSVSALRDMFQEPAHLQQDEQMQLSESKGEAEMADVDEINFENELIELAQSQVSCPKSPTSPSLATLATII